MMSHPALLINGVWRQGRGAEFGKADPVGNQPLWRANAADADDVAAACEAARAAFPGWARTPFEQREQLVKRFAALLEEHKQSLAETISRETGKPRWETLTEIQAMIGKVGISLQAYQTRTGFSQWRWPTALRCCAIVRTACWRCSGLTTSPAICRTAISCRRCWPVTAWYSNRAS